MDQWTRRMFLQRSALAAGMSLVGFDLLAACATTSTTTEVKPTRGGTLVEGYPVDIVNLNPVFVQQSFVLSLMVANYLFDSLLVVDSNGTMIPLLAKSLPTVSSDNKTYTFNLRQDVKWTDGQPLTADDVVFTYRLTYDPAFEGINYALRASAQNIISRVSAKDKYTVVVETTKPYAPFLITYAQLGIIPAHVFQGLGAKEINTHPFNKSPNVTSGVFKLSRWDQGQQLVFDRNEKYYRGPALIDSYVYRILSNTTQSGTLLGTGELDLANILDFGQLDQVRANDKLAISSISVPRWDYLYFQMDPAKPASKIFGQKEVRQALSYAVDRNAILKAVYFGQGAVADSTEPPTSWAYNPNVKKYGYDPKRAGQMLDAAGWTLGSGGIRAKGGDQMRVELTYFTGGNTSAPQVIQQQWKAVGVDVTLKALAIAPFNNKILQTRDFDAIFFTNNFPVDPDISNLYHSRSTAPGGLNTSHYINPEVDKLLDDAVTTLDQGQRKQKYIRVQDILADEQPVLGVVWNQRIFGYNKRVHGLKFSAYNQLTPRPWIKDVSVTSK